MRLANEKQIQDSICAYLDLLKIPYAVTDASLMIGRDGSIRRRVSSGWSDITACLNGRLWAIEVKSANGRLRPAQVLVLEKLKKSGALVTVARSVDDVKKVYENEKAMSPRLIHRLIVEH